MSLLGRVEPLLYCLLLSPLVVLQELHQVEAAYRLTFQNGTSFEVQSYEDLGDAIQYQRFGGTITVPKAYLRAIRVLPPAPAALTPPVTVPLLPSDAVSVPGPLVNQGPVEEPRQAVHPNPPPISPPAAARPALLGIISGAVRVLGGFAVVLFMAAGFVIVFRLLVTMGRKQDSLPYEKKGALLTPAERSFYGVLSHAVDGQYSIFAKVRLADLLAVSRSTGNWRSHQNRLDPRHVDFVLCSPEDFAPLLVIELDDASHTGRDCQESDAFKDAAFGAADLPMLRVPAQHAYAPAELRTLIDGRLTDRRHEAYAGREPK